MHERLAIGQPLDHARVADSFAQQMHSRVDRQVQLRSPAGVVAMGVSNHRLRERAAKDRCRILPPGNTDPCGVTSMQSGHERRAPSVARDVEKGLEASAGRANFAVPPIIAPIAAEIDHAALISDPTRRPLRRFQQIMRNEPFLAAAQREELRANHKERSPTMKPGVRLGGRRPIAKWAATESAFASNRASHAALVRRVMHGRSKTSAWSPTDARRSCRNRSSLGIRPPVKNSPPHPVITPRGVKHIGLRAMAKDVHEQLALGSQPAGDMGK